MRAVRWLLSWALVLASVAPGVSAPHRLGMPRPDLVGDWRARLERIDGEIRAGDYESARRGADRVLAEMVERIEGGEGAGSLLGMAVLLRGLAAAGAGDLESGAWDFATAVALEPAFRHSTFVDYGEAGRNLAAAPAFDQMADSRILIAAADVEPPTKRRAPAPDYPLAHRYACLDGPAIVQFVVGVDGRPRSPRILSSPSPVLTFAAMDSARHWRFSPARRDDQPVPVWFNLSVNFEIPICTNPVARARANED